MSNATELGVALASKLRLGEGVQRASRALDVAKVGLGGQLKRLDGPAAVAAMRPVIVPDAAERSAGRSDAAPEASPRNMDRAVMQQPVALGSKAGVGGQPGMPFRNDAGAARTMGTAKRAKLTMLDSPGNTVARSSAEDAGKVISAAPGAIVPRNIVRALEAEAHSAGSGAGPGWGAPPPSLATSAAGRVAAKAALQTQLAYGAQATGDAPVERATQSGLHGGENARAGTISNAPVAISAARRGVMTPSDEQGLQNTSAAWNGTQGAQSGATTSAASPDAGQTANSAPTGGDVYLDGALMGRWMARNLANQASRPASGGAGFDPRRGVFPTGAMIGG